MTDNVAINVRPAHADDIPTLRAFLNEIIRIGGTTAHETPFTDESFAAHFLTCPGFVSCYVAEDADGRACAFQGLERWAGLPDGWVDIGTFARPHAKVRGAGMALFTATKAYARAAGFQAINATIRADNIGGLAYYGKMGFIDYKVDKAVPLQDGRPVDRSSKCYLL
ncbi:GNAT family N-acetyltransferase [Sinorhizobium terangae]|uniref:GNAT family N-acetyltransferase n=1 Tax=Sinorhizobium terangae TaxID=110322 RepID=A0A6N7LQJ9_SINTE|nr:GNAT family N-acetyltransferase [Sinorhizobium terangae]MBB4183581.1 L-amino acid N-acyltransferase YncA [Sinorhizobium terangae]MQX18714.1 GNAT family N-acetyltransferase [Sinorhizobium terangae]WFU47736.1 GNAT family N-acetyltransferase [Sinorhizobium terangae]